LIPILFLDDDPQRHELVDGLVLDQPAHLIRRVVDHAWSAEDAMTKISGVRQDVVFLDFDLDLFVPFARDGMAVVEHIVMLPRERRPRKVVIHSLNQGTAPQRMMDALEGHVSELSRAPFASPKMVEEMLRHVHGGM
jgi:DNA-binding NarL/FixJ family response regulator